MIVARRYMELDYQYDAQKESVVLWENKEGSIRALPPLFFTAEESSEYQGIMADIDTFVQEMTVNLISGNTSFDDYDGQIESVKNMGIERAIEIQQAAFDRYLNRGE